MTPLMSTPKAFKMKKAIWKAISWEIEVKPLYWNLMGLLVVMLALFSFIMMP